MRPLIRRRRGCGCDCRGRRFRCGRYRGKRGYGRESRGNDRRGLRRWRWCSGGGRRNRCDRRRFRRRRGGHRFDGRRDGRFRWEFRRGWYRRHRRRDIAGTPVAICGAASFGVVGLGFSQLRIARFSMGFQFCAPGGTRMHCAHKEDKTGRNRHDGKDKHPWRTGGAGRKDRSEIGAIQPGEVSPASGQHGANQKLEYTHHHNAAP